MSRCWLLLDSNWCPQAEMCAALWIFWSVWGLFYWISFLQIAYDLFNITVCGSEPNGANHSSSGDLQVAVV